MHMLICSGTKTNKTKESGTVTSIDRRKPQEYLLSMDEHVVPVSLFGQSLLIGNLLRKICL
jgi:hypothetical protein